jgi:hypothetical protein
MAELGCRGIFDWVLSTARNAASNNVKAPSEDPTSALFLMAMASLHEQ